MRKNPYIIQKILVQPIEHALLFPFVTALGKKSTTKNIIVTVQLARGIRGYGEASSSLALAHQTQEGMAKALIRLSQKLRGMDVREYAPLIRAAWELEPTYPTAVAALECAIFDALTRAWGVPLYQFFGGSQTEVDTTYTISAWPAQTAARVAKTMAHQGFRLFKIKVGSGDLSEDLRRVESVVKAVPHCEVILDANQGFDASGALSFVKTCERKKIPSLALEQPVPKDDHKALAKVTKACPIPVLADESVMNPADAVRLLANQEAKMINVKLAKSGVLGALEILSIARAGGLDLMMGCMAESKVGLAFSVHLACGTGAFSLVDLDSDILIKNVPCSGGYKRRGPEVSVKGMGPVNPRTQGGRL